MDQTIGISKYNSGILAGMDATAIAEHIRQNNISVTEALDCIQQRVNSANPTINAVVASDFERYKENGTKAGFFAGVPIYVKDLVHVKGFPTRHGCSGIPPTIAKKNDKYIDQLMSSGCIIVGKSATSEFGLLPSSETLLNGNTCNPLNTAYSTGGSSGGAGALVAAGVIPMAHAMDGGGSIRIPAACCGLVGLKPSRGRHAESPTGFLPVDIVTNGVLTRTVRDTANYFASMEKYYLPKKLKAIGLVNGPSKKRLKIAMFTQSPAGIEAHPDVCHAVQQAGKICESLGHEVTYIPNPYDDNILFDFLIYYCLMGRLIKTFGKVVYDWKFDASKVEPFTKGLARYCLKFSPMLPGAIRRLRKNVMEDYKRLMSTYDILLNPTLLGPTPKLAHYGPDVGFISLIMRLNNYITFTMMQNTNGAPAISLPMGICSNGLPIGVQFAAAIGEERILLELAFELEQAKTFVDLEQLI